MKRTLLPLAGSLMLLGSILTLRAEVMFDNLNRSGDFRGFSPGFSSGTLFTTGANPAQVNAVTLEHLLYNPANPPQHFQVQLYQVLYQPGNPNPTLNLLADLGAPAVEPTPTATPGLTTFVAYAPAAPLMLEGSTTYALVVGEALDGAAESSVGFTDSLSYDTSAAWLLGGDLFGLNLGTSQVWSFSSGQLKFKVDASPVVNQPPDLSNAHASVSVLWPADGRMASFHIDGVTDPDGDPVTFAITGIEQDEPVGKLGPDALVNGSDTAAVRATRLGKGNGRVYKVSFTATDGKPNGVANGVVYIAVPHDQAHLSAVDDGPVTGYFDSTAP